MRPQAPLLPLVRSFFESDPAEAAHCLETMEEEKVIAVLSALPSNLSAQVFAHLPPSFAAELFKALPAELFKAMVEKLDPRQGAALFLHLSPEVRQKLIEEFPEKVRHQIQDLLTYPEETAGRIMSPDFLAFHKDVKVKDAVQRIRLLARKKSTASYAYVTDQENRLMGVMNMRDLMLAPSDASLESVMRKDIFSVDCFMDRETLANALSARRYFAVPVVDNENRLLGVVRAEDLIGEVQEEATEDIQKMFGAGGDERAFSPIRFSIKMRLPWLYVNLATAFLAAAVVGIFEGTIEKLTVLAVFLPVVPGQGGNAGAQSLAVVLRALVMREIPPHKVVSLILKETGLGLIHGLATGAVTALVTWLWHGNPMLGVVIGLAMVVNLAVAGFAGAAIPILMKAAGLDPAQCSNIILTTITDVMGFFSFLGFAVLFQNYLM